MANVSIELPHHQYNIRIEAGILDHAGKIIQSVAPHSKCGLIADSEVYGIYGQQVEATLKAAGYEVTTHVIPHGEGNKNLSEIEKAWSCFLDARLERKSPIIALGGGVIGDMTGFVAATYLRGVPFIQIPTTLLAMVDASVGGKTGINFPQGKNLIGAFHQPDMVLMDPLTLQTLPPRVLKSGMAEVVKHGVLGSPELFHWVKAQLAKIQTLDMNTMTDLLAQNVRIKADVVMQDEKEAGIRAHLNYGHTFAHAIEATAGYGEFTHGEAVSLGMVAATQLAEKQGLCGDDVLPQLVELLSNIGLPVKGQLVAADKLIDIMRSDKKVKNNKIRLVLPNGIGGMVIRDDMPLDAIEAAWDFIREA